MTGLWAWIHDGAEILGSLGSALAVGVALWLALRDGARAESAEKERDKALSAQRHAEQTERRRERERQARQVAVWIDSREQVVWESLPGGGEGPVTEYVLNIANYSPHPIFDVGPGHYARLGGGDVQPLSLDRRAPILHPGETQRFTLGTEFPTGGVQDPLWFFRDLVGVMWYRLSTGALHAEVLQPMALEHYPRQ